MDRKTHLGVLLALALALPSLTFAQKNWKAGFAVGGASSQWYFSTPEEDPDFHWTNAWGLHFALPVEIGINDFLAFQGVLGWTQKGAKVTLDYFDGYYHVQAESKAQVNYFDVPLLLKVSTKPGKVRGFANAGVYLGFALNGKIKATATVTDENGHKETETDTEDIDFDEMEMNRTDLGLVVGGGLRFDQYFFEVRYLHGSTNLDNSGDAEAAIYNRCVTISAGCFF